MAATQLRKRRELLGSFVIIPVAREISELTSSDRL